MQKEKSSKMKIWMYAVILFTSAFIVLLLTAVSQIKLSKNIDDYKDRLSSKDTENYQFKMNLNSALEENDRLLKKSKELEEKLLVANSDIEAIKKDLSILNNKLENQSNAYEALLKAKEAYNNSDFILCAEIILEDIDSSILGENALKEFSKLKEESYKEASLELYKIGYSRYNKKIYVEAAAAFRKSLDFVENEYYSDDCLYLLAYSEYHLGNQNKAVEHMTDFILKYPKSIYLENAKQFLLNLE